jgi:hypothetical protein
MGEGIGRPCTEWNGETATRVLYLGRVPLQTLKTVSRKDSDPCLGSKGWMSDITLDSRRRQCKIHVRERQWKMRSDGALLLLIALEPAA